MTLLLTIAPVTEVRVAEQAAKTAVLVIILIIGFRVTGKRELSQFNVYDLAMIMALSNGVQNAMTGGLGNFPVGLATSTTIVVSAWALGRVFERPKLEARVLGTPILLVNNGRVLRAQLRRERVTDDELDEACREHGVGGPSDCHMVVLEIDGSMSVVPRSSRHADGDPKPPSADP